MLNLQAQSLTSANIAHGFLGRIGGVSQGIYASLNCGPGSKDQPHDVAQNRKIAVKALSGESASTLVTCYQIHSAKAVTVSAPWAAKDSPQADAMVTNCSGIMLGVLTADCAPVLFADHQARIIGAAHAGWNGALGGIIESAVMAMTELGALRQNIHAAIGPCIGQAAYEVGPEFKERFSAQNASHAGFFTPSMKAGHWQFALEEFVAAQLQNAKVGHIGMLAACTYSRESDFFSYRRATHRSEPDYGRQLSAIVLSN